MTTHSFRPTLAEPIVESPPPRRLISPVERKYLTQSPLEPEVAMGHLNIRRVRFNNFGPAEGTWWLRL